MKLRFFTAILLAFALYSCSDESENGTEENENDAPKESLDVRLRREVTTALNIPATERYSLRIYREYINSDTIQDAIITVNRLQFAINESARKKLQVKAAEMGYLGNYNFFFYYDGALDKISVPLPISSSPGRELDVSFRPITSKTKMDVMIDYRIRNSGYRNYYSVFNEHDLSTIFKWEVFDLKSEKGPIAFLHAFEPNPDGISYDISIYESEIDNLSESSQMDVYQFVPKITKRNELVFKFFLDRNVGKFGLYKEFVKNVNRYR